VASGVVADDHRPRPPAGWAPLVAEARADPAGAEARAGVAGELAAAHDDRLARVLLPHEHPEAGVVLEGAPDHPDVAVLRRQVVLGLEHQARAPGHDLAVPAEGAADDRDVLGTADGRPVPAATLERAVGDGDAPGRRPAGVAEVEAVLQDAADVAGEIGRAHV